MRCLLLLLVAKGIDLEACAENSGRIDEEHYCALLLYRYTMTITYARLRVHSLPWAMCLLICSELIFQAGEVLAVISISRSQDGSTPQISLRNLCSPLALSTSAVYSFTS